LKRRAFAPYIYNALLAAQQSIACGERDAAAIKCRAAAVSQHAPEIKREHFELMDPDTIRPVDVVRAPVRAALAVWIAETRLIDNVLCEPPTRFCDSKPISDRCVSRKCMSFCNLTNFLLQLEKRPTKLVQLGSSGM
jgi:hypothetical protein